MWIANIANQMKIDIDWLRLIIIEDPLTSRFRPFDAIRGNHISKSEKATDSTHVCLYFASQAMNTK